MSFLVLLVEFLWHAKKTSNLSVSKLKLAISNIFKNFFKQKFVNVFKTQENYNQKTTLIRKRNRYHLDESLF